MFIITESDSYGALRYRTRNTLKKAIPSVSFAIAFPHPQTAIASLDKRFSYN
ncbi:MAG: hypothetical protein PT120_20760 [Aphanizomenon gracile PMC649.10]|nr:hypothetical protein [Aphanizomenon gracile PMC649.10]